jgi:hypothetical protein
MILSVQQNGIFYARLVYSKNTPHCDMFTVESLPCTYRPLVELVICTFTRISVT